jgi:hypothetical protein
MTCLLSPAGRLRASNAVGSWLSPVGMLLDEIVTGRAGKNVGAVAVSRM